jgi:2'-hydroxyisoflavone reductase
MKILLIGGTRFLGRHLVSAAVERNHDVTLFNRGNYQSPSNTKQITGDRDRDLSKLQGCDWDAVIDTCGIFPSSIAASAENLSPHVGVYVFISSMSVYADVSVPGVKETALLKTLTNDQLNEANHIHSSNSGDYGSLYGGLKALCEQTLIDVIPDRSLIIRPGLIVGPYDYTDRFTYWVMRVQRGGEVLAPGRPGRSVQFIDARDLSEWIIRMIELKASGTYNANGLAGSVTMEEVLSACKTVTNSDATFTWVSESFLLEENVTAWSKMPLWLPEDYAPLSGFMFLNCDKAISTGLKSRQLNDTIAAIHSWRQQVLPDEPLSAGLDKESEDRLLRKWHEAMSIKGQE